MFFIRDEQLSALATVTRQAFVALACEHLRRHFPDVDAERGDLWPGRVERALTQAAALGLHSTHLQWRFLHLSAVTDWDFIKRPQLQWVMQILTDPRVSSASERLDRAFDELRYRVATQVANEALVQGSVDTRPAHE